MSIDQPSSSPALPYVWPDRPEPATHELLADAATIELIEGRAASFVRAYQAERVGSLLGFVRRTYPFWQERLKDLQPRSAFSAVPILVREQFRAFNESNLGAPKALPPEHGRVGPNATSGSSGTPSKFLTTELHQRMIRAQALRDHRRQGRDLSLTTITIRAGRPPKQTGEYLETRNAVLLGGGRQLDRGRATSTIEGHARFLASERADYFLTTPTVLAGILDCFETDPASAPKYQQVMTYSETVTNELRERTTAIFGASLRDCYSCEEVGPIAHECPSAAGYYHLASTQAFVEVLDDDDRPVKSGEPGRIVVTSLHNWASPVIRYEIGDVGSLRSSCPCGHPHPVLFDLLGRRLFLIRLPSGNRAVASSNAREWVAIAPFLGTRVVQVSLDTIVAEYVLDRDLTTEEAAAVVRMLEIRISAELRYVVKRVEAIPTNPGGKSQAVISLV